jgi:thioredoxin 1
MDEEEDVMGNAIVGTDANFEQLVIKSDVPVLVDFWAPWCGPCRMVGPVLDEVAKEYEGKAKVVKVNVDEETGVAGALGVRSIPTVAVFKGGEVVDVLVGARPKAAFVAALEKVVAVAA